MAACPKCTHQRVVKSGKVTGTQRWLCQGCGYQFTRTTPRGRPVWQKSLAVFLYCHGGLDHTVGHLRIFAADFEARGAAQRSPKSPQTLNAVSEQKTAPLLWCRQSG